MRMFLMSAVSALALCSNAWAGGDDHFGGMETSAHSSFGGFSGFGSHSSFSSAQEGHENYSVEALGQDDSIGPGGHYTVNTFLEDRFRGTATLVAHNVDESVDVYRVRDETVRGGYRTVGVPVDRPRTPAPAPGAVAPRPSPVAPRPVDMPQLSGRLPGPAPAPAAPRTLEPTVPGVSARLPGPQPVSPGAGKRATYGTLERSLDALHDIVVNERPGLSSLTAAQKTAAGLVNMGAFAAIGAMLGGKVHSGTLGRIEGAILSGGLAEARRQRNHGTTPFDDDVRDALTVTEREFANMAATVRGFSPSQVDRFNRMVADVRRSHDRRTDQQDRENRTDRPSPDRSRSREGSLHSNRE